MRVLAPAVAKQGSGSLTKSREGTDEGLQPCRSSPGRWGDRGGGAGPRLGGGEACEGAQDLTVAGPAARRGRGRGAHDLPGR
jgi:hypothetical protein